MTTHWLPWWIDATDVVIRILLAVHVIYRRRPVAITLAWIAALAAIPFLSSFVYLLIGERRLGIRRLRQYEAFTRRIQTSARELWKSRHLECEVPQFDPLARLATAAWGIPPLRGNRLTLFGDDDAFLQSLVRDIDNARHHAHLLFYIWAQDAGATHVAEAMIRAAKRGVECRVIADGVGSWAFIRSPLWKRMQEAGVQLVEALPVNWFRRPFARIDLRNHRKIAVFDGALAYCGSQNIHDTSFRFGRWRRRAQWIDASVRVEGPAAQALAMTFLRDWEMDSDHPFADHGPYLPEVSVSEDADSVVQILPSGPGEAPHTIQQAILTLIYAAREELVMTNPYFVPDDAVLAALIAAASRGVKVTLILTVISDAPLVSAASRACYPELLAAGVRIWHFAGGLLHSKTLTVDRHAALVGSANLDNRSFYLNFEVTMLVYDTNFTSALRSLQTAYLKDSFEISPEKWKRRAFWRVMVDNTALLLGPLL